MIENAYNSDRGHPYKSEDTNQKPANNQMHYYMHLATPALFQNP